MTEIQKAALTTQGDTFQATMGFVKVDKENRLVSGFATLDNVDEADDVVEAQASKMAFERFRGNIREMHQPIAAGRLVDFRPDSYYDPETKKSYSGIFVQAYVSKGAEDTWQKVLDGTLTGFSIGGNIKRSESEFVKNSDGDGGRTVRFIKEYDLGELSLVDNPCNQLANIFSIQKSSTGSVIKGMVTDVEVVNVFWCANDNLAKNSTEESADCRVCGNGMSVIGWFEGGGDEAAKVEETVTKFLRQREGDDVAANGEGGVKKMADENVETTEEAAPVEEVVSEEVVEEEAQTTEEAEPVEEVSSEADFEKLFDDLKDTVTKSIEESKTTLEKSLSDVVDEVNEIKKSVDESASKGDEIKEELRNEFTKALDELSLKLDGIATEREDMEKRLDAIESATAIKKSSDGDEPADDNKLQKGFWSGAILK